MRTAFEVVVLSEALFQIISGTNIQRPIGALEYIDEVHREYDTTRELLSLANTLGITYFYGRSNKFTSHEYMRSTLFLYCTALR